MQDIYSNILFEDSDIIVCKKPAFIATQSKNIRTPDMVSLLKNHLMRTGSSKGAPYIAVIHRLDQPVEGILVFAKNKSAATNLNKQLNNHGFGKHYRALVQGTPKKASGTLIDYLKKDSSTNTSRVVTVDAPNAKKAILSYQTVTDAPFYYTETPSGTTELDIKLDSGRHHQIRVQLSHLGCPIIGDSKYGSSVSPAGKGLCLCAYHLEFRHPKTNKPMCFSLIK